MNIVTRRPIRLFCDFASPNQALEQFTKYPPVIVRGAPTVFQLGFGRLRQLFGTISDQMTSLTVQVRQTSDPSSAVLLEQSINTGFNDALLDADWNAGEDQHCEIEFTAAETNQAAGEYWLAIWFNDLDGNPVAICFGKITVKESGAGTNGTPAEPLSQYLTRTESDARYARLYDDSAFFRILNGKLQLKNSDTGEFQDITIAGAAGEESIVIGASSAGANYRLKVSGEAIYLQLINTDTDKFHTLTISGEPGSEGLSIGAGEE